MNIEVAKYSVDVWAAFATSDIENNLRSLCLVAACGVERRSQKRPGKKRGSKSHLKGSDDHDDYTQGQRATVQHALMSRTYTELKAEIARLEAEAERVRRFELPTVISELNLLIERYELTQSMIFGVSRKENLGRPRTVLVPRYVDQATGNTWTGRGPKPAWLSEALIAGTLAENLLVS